MHEIAAMRPSRPAGARRAAFAAVPFACLLVSSCGADAPPANPLDTGPQNPPDTAGEKGGSSPAPAPVLVFERVWEKNEKAFSYLLPRGWTSEGGIFHVNPLTGGGPANSLMPKCDLTLRKDPSGSVAMRWLPTTTYADLSKGQFAMTAGFFPPGSNYQGMTVRPLPAWEQFLGDLFKTIRPKASDVETVQKEPIPELAAIYRKLHKPVNDFCISLGLPAMEHHAGGLVVDYSEGGIRYREALVTAIVDNRGAAAAWSNEYTLAMRAPAAEAKRWKPVFDVLRQSIRFNPKWVAEVSKAAGERAEMVEETMKYVQRIDREIVESRRKTHADIRYEGYLTLTGQDDYVNPFTKEVELDTNEYEYRWTTAGGDKLFTDDRSFDPNEDRELQKREWKLTPVRKRE